MSKSPAFQFYPGDWLSSQAITLMTPEHEGAYIRLLCFDWDQDGIPDDDELLGRLSRLNEGWLKGGSKVVKKCFIPHPNKPGFLTNPRLQIEREKQKKWSEKSSAGGKKSAEKRAKGAELKGGSTKGQPKVNRALQPKANSSSSSSSSNISSKEDIPGGQAPRRDTLGNEKPVQEEIAGTAPLLDPLSKHPLLAAWYPNAWVLIRRRHPLVKDPSDHEPHKEALARIVRLDGIPEKELIDCFEWLFSPTPDRDAEFWCQQVQSLAALRNKHGLDTLNKVQKIVQKYRYRGKQAASRQNVSACRPEDEPGAFRA